MLIRRTRSNVHRHEGRFFYPGVNFLPDGEAEKFMEQESFTRQLEAKAPDVPPMMVVSDKKAESFVDALNKLSAKEAVTVVKETWHLDMLNEVIQNDKRQSVVHTAQVQIEELRREPSAEERAKSPVPETVRATHQSLGDYR